VTYKEITKPKGGLLQRQKKLEVSHEKPTEHYHLKLSILL